MLSQLAEDCAQEAMIAVAQRLAEFRGESHFTTWAYTFAVNIALVAARRERWAHVPLDHVLDRGESLSLTAGDDADPQRRALQAEAVAAIDNTGLPIPGELLLVDRRCLRSNRRPPFRNRSPHRASLLLFYWCQINGGSNHADARDKTAPLRRRRDERSLTGREGTAKEQS